jgi:hypothetical protein
MGEVDEDPKSLSYDVVALFAANACDEAHPTCIVLITRMIKPLRVGDTMTMFRCLH